MKINNYEVIGECIKDIVRPAFHFAAGIGASIFIAHGYFTLGDLIDHKRNKTYQPTSCLRKNMENIKEGRELENLLESSSYILGGLTGLMTEVYIAGSIINSETPEYMYGPLITTGFSMLGHLGYKKFKSKKKKFEERKNYHLYLKKLTQFSP